jgi:hypothetical protein
MGEVPQEQVDGFANMVATLANLADDAASRV